MTYSIGVPTLVFYSAPRGMNPPEPWFAAVGIYFSEETAIWSTQPEPDWPSHEMAHEIP